MDITIFNEKEQTAEKISFSGQTVKELLSHLEINPETVLVVKNSEVITEKEILSDQDKLELLSVVSGG